MIITERIIYMKFLLIYLLIINLLSYLLFVSDKKKAKKKQWRIPEKTLLLSALAGGALGALLSMYQYHHKTKHAIFVIGVPICLILWIGILSYLWFHVGLTL